MCTYGITLKVLADQIKPEAPGDPTFIIFWVTLQKSPNQVIVTLFWIEITTMNIR